MMMDSAGIYLDVTTIVSIIAVYVKVSERLSALETSIKYLNKKFFALGDVRE